MKSTIVATATLVSWLAMCELLFSPARFRHSLKPGRNCTPAEYWGSASVPMRTSRFASAGISSSSYFSRH